MLLKRKTIYFKYDIIFLGDLELFCVSLGIEGSVSSSLHYSHSDRTCYQSHGTALFCKYFNNILLRIFWGLRQNCLLHISGTLTIVPLSYLNRVFHRAQFSGYYYLLFTLCPSDKLFTAMVFSTIAMPTIFRYILLADLTLFTRLHLYRHASMS